MWFFNLERKYQQWQQGNPNYKARYMDFVELISHEYNLSINAVLEELQKYPWFKRP